MRLVEGRGTQAGSSSHKEKGKEGLSEFHSSNANRVGQPHMHDRSALTLGDCLGSGKTDDMDLVVIIAIYLMIEKVVTIGGYVCLTQSADGFSLLYLLSHCFAGGVCSWTPK
jgi:hypothetical protein